MFDINLKNVKKGKGFYLIFLIVGSIVALICLLIFINTIKTKNSFNSSVEAYEVDDNCDYDDDDDWICHPIYYYRVGNAKYVCKSKTGSSFVNSNDRTVYYDKRNPAKCMTQFESSTNYFILIGVALGGIFIAVAVVGMLKVSKRIKIIKALNTTGTLIKNVPYSLKETGMVVNNVAIMKPVCDFNLPNGVPVHLEGDGRHDRKYNDADGRVDVLIDMNDLNNYFIDFEINAIGQGSNAIYDYNSYGTPAVVANAGQAMAGAVLQGQQVVQPMMQQVVQPSVQQSSVQQPVDPNNNQNM